MTNIREMMACVNIEAACVAALRAKNAYEFIAYELKELACEFIDFYKLQKSGIELS